MKRIISTFVVVAVAGFLLAAAAQQAPSKSLAEAAREARADRQPVPASRVFTNDNLPTQGSISTNTADTLPADTASDAKTKDAKGAAADDPVQQRAKLEKEWRKKIGDQKAKVQTLQQDVDRIGREMQMQGTINSWGSAGCLNDQKKCDDAIKAYQDELASKKQELQSEQDKLDAMRDDLRRAGLPSSWGD